MTITQSNHSDNTSHNDEHSHAFTQFLLDCGALKFGNFTLKSGRKSPYFINSGSFNDGSKIASLGAFYAQTIIRHAQAGDFGVDINHIDTIFGPAYKGIPLAVSTSIALNALQEIDTGYTFDRKEAKDHGDGGLFVGTALHDGMNIVLVDDVMTAGTAVRDVVAKIYAAAKVNIVGLVLSVDRMEKANNSDLSAVQAVERDFNFPVFPIVTVRDIFSAAQNMRDENGNKILTDEIITQADKYMEQYGA